MLERHTLIILELIVNKTIADSTSKTISEWALS
jgi:hypothetical protein